MGSCSPTCSLITLVTSAFICLIGWALRSYLPNLVENTIMKNTVLSKTSIIYDFWVEPPFPIYTKFYVFNYTNHQLISNRKRPAVTQLGPYVYRHIARKNNITFVTADEVEYFMHEELIFVPELSNGTEADLVIFPNVVFRGIVQSQEAKIDPLGVLAILRDAPNTSTESFTKQTVGNYLLDGYYDPIIQDVYEQTGKMQADGKFSITKRVTVSGPIRIKTGFNKTSEFGTIVEYQHKRFLDFWPKNSSCSLIRGTDGTVFPPRLRLGEKLYVYSEDFCRAFNLRYERQVDHYGVKANRFILDPDSMSNTNPDNECYCQTPLNECWHPGLYNMGPCKYNVPILLSQPHFYNADFKLKQSIEGMAPDPSIHEFHLDLETIISLPLNVSASIQLNLGIVPNPDIKKANTLPKMVLPIAWISNTFVVNETLTDMMKSMIIDGPLMVSQLVPQVTLGLGGFLALLGIVCAIRHMYRATRKREETMKEKNIVHTFAY